MELTKGRDLRKKGWFWLDNEYLNGYAKHLGTTASCVYISLCRHIDKDQTCFPKMTKIGEELGVSKMTVVRAIKKLEKWKIIEVKREYDDVKKRQKANVYLLLDKEFWLPKPDQGNKIIPSYQGNKISQSRVTKTIESRVSQVDHKETHIKGTHIKDGNAEALREVKPKYTTLGAEVVEAFIQVDPKNKSYYKNTTQREAADFLIETYGLEEVLKRISVLPKTNKVPYFPKITSPYDLKEKWVKLEDAVHSKRAEKNKISKLTPNYIL